MRDQSERANTAGQQHAKSCLARTGKATGLLGFTLFFVAWLLMALTHFGPGSLLVVLFGAGVFTIGVGTLLMSWAGVTSTTLGSRLAALVCMLFGALVISLLTDWGIRLFTGVAGLFLFVVGVGLLRGSIDFVRHAAKAQGTIVEHTKDFHGAVVRYTLTSGVEMTMKCVGHDFDSNRPPPIGTRIGVLYDTREPEHARINNESTRIALWVGPIIFLGFGAAFPVVAITNAGNFVATISGH